MRPRAMMPVGLGVPVDQRNRTPGHGRREDVGGAMFDTGDAIVHPTRGVGVIVNIQEREWQGSSSRYYQIELLGSEPTLKLLIPVEEAEGLGLRRAIESSEIDQVWKVLTSEPNELPSNHKTRHSQLRDKLHDGDIYQTAEILRDLTWRQKKEDHLTTRGKRIYDNALVFLAGEVAAAQDTDVAEAEAQIRERLQEIRHT